MLNRSGKAEGKSRRGFHNIIICCLPLKPLTQIYFFTCSVSRNECLYNSAQTFARKKAIRLKYDVNHDRKSFLLYVFIAAVERIHEIMFGDGK